MNSIPPKEQITGTLSKVSVVLDNISKMRDMLDNKLATRFSVFQVLGDLSETEVSKILAHLLNPRESHAQGDKFLKLFLQMLSQNYGTMQNVLSTDICPLDKVLASPELFANAVVKTEDHTDANRRIDVTLQIGKFTIGIENKLWAVEQKNQLADYWKSLAKNNEINRAQAVLIFLCVGKDRTPESMDKIQLTQLTKDGNFFQINYEDDIIPWLKECVKVTEAEKIRWYLEEIINWINKYCYWREDFMNDKKILLDIANENESVFKTMLYIQNNLDAVKTSFIEGYLIYMQSRISENLKCFPKWDLHIYERDSIAKGIFTLKLVHVSKVYIAMAFSAKPFNNLSYAIHVPQKDNRLYSELKSRLSDRLGDQHAYGCSADCPLYVWYEDSLKWNDSPDFLIKLYHFSKSPGGSELKQKADDFINRMLEDITIVETVLQSQATHST